MASDEESNTNDATSEVPYPSEGYAWYVVFVLMLVYVFSFVDRQALGLLAPAIKEDMGLSDVSMSYLMGIYFALFYTLFGVPIGRLADTRSRRGLIAVGLVLWSFMTAFTGLARHYWQIAFCRLGVGVGEATLSPSAYSLITDYFRPNRTALALSIYGAGIYLGSGLAFILGGLVIRFAGGEDMLLPVLGTVRPWQFVFIAVGIPGLLFALALLTVKEPFRRGIRKGKDFVSIAEAFSYIGSNWRTVLCHNVGIGMVSLIGYGTFSWVSTFFLRIHEWELSRTGMTYGVAVMIFGTSGIVFGGWFAEYLARRGYEDSKMRVAFLAMVAHVPVGILFPIMPSGELALAISCPSIFLLAMPIGVAPAAIQQMMPNRMRAQASAVYLFIINLIGLGLGPTAIAWMTDRVLNDEARIHHSLLIVNTAACIVGAVLLYFGMRHFRNSLTRLEEWHAKI